MKHSMMLSWFFVFGSLIIGCAVNVSESPTHDVSFESHSTICRRPVYRAYQTRTGDHLYTIDEQEAFALPPVWRDEGIPFFACDSPARPDMVEIKRYYSWTNTDHYYLPANQRPPYGYNLEGTAFWIFRRERHDLVPLFLARLRDGTDTILTIDPNEVVSLRNEPAWNVMGIIGYVRPYDTK